MHITFLNIWRGKVWSEFSSFVEENSKDTDIFCFMETFDEVHDQISGLLPEHVGIYEVGGMDKNDHLIYGQSIFVRKNIDILSIQKYHIRNDWTGVILNAHLKTDGKEFDIFNIHGISMPGEKLDTPERLEQSGKIIEVAEGPFPKIIGGDFNLYPDTESVVMFEKAGYRNLIRDYEIKNTRNQLSWKQFNNVQHFADYCFTSPDVKVNSFEVPYNEISDHLPLILDFEI